MNISWPTAILLGMVIGMIAAAVARSEDRAADDSVPDTGAASAPATAPSAPGTGTPSPTGPQEKTVTLTFDDGPHPTHTAQVLRLLDEHEVRAVFCVVGEQVREHPEVVRDVVEHGHQLCNHTDTHDPELATRSEERIEDEIEATADAIEDAVPEADVRFFRQPAIHVTANVADVSDDFDYVPLNWTIDPRDWSRPGTDAIVADVLGELEPGAVVLLHDGGGDRAGTIEALGTLLDAFDTMGYRVVLPAGAP